MLNVVHVTHEAVHKIGGIGAVIEGLIPCAEYAEAVGRTILVCPLWSRETEPDARLGPEGEVLYSSLDGRAHHGPVDAFRRIQHDFHVEIVYGHRTLRDPMTGRAERPEVLLIDVSRMSPEPVNHLKHRFFERFGIDSRRFENSWEYEQWLRLAEPALAAVRALLGGLGGAHDACVIVGHEFMGLPTALAAKLHPEWKVRTVYHAHEVPTIRKIVEEHPGHDTMFYNVMAEAEREGKYLPDVFGDFSHYFRHALVEASRHLDVTLAVSDLVAEELRFLSPRMAQSNIVVAYNGIPAHECAAEEFAISKRRLQDYAQALLGDRPDFVFTHVTRMTPSKGLWRDLAVMEHVEREFRRRGTTAVLFVLSTEIGGPRRSEDVLHMERWWDWPVAHREGQPDLSSGEALYYAGVQTFNARSRNCKVVYINQFGFDRGCCGTRMPEAMEFWDIRKGSDAEFGQSIYEPFGIAQVEALSFGAICVLSSACGSAAFVERLVGRGGTPNVVVADYIGQAGRPGSIESVLRMEREERETVDRSVAAKAAGELLSRLPASAAEKSQFVRRGYELAERMSWNAVTRNYIIPALRGETARLPEPALS